MQPARAEMFTFGGILTPVVTIGASAVTIGSLCATALAAAGRSPNDVMQVIIMEKIAAGTDRDAVLIGDSAAHTNAYYGAGIPGDPPVRGLDWFVTRAGGADVTATLMIGLAG